jgi:hypothetical protein
VTITIARRGPGERSWAVLVNGKVVVQGLTRSEAGRERLRLWHAAPEQRAAARERICGG